MKFLYENLYEIYIPYVKPEDVIYYKGKKYIKKKKLTIRRLFWQVYIMYKMRKSLDLQKLKIKKNSAIVNSSSRINIDMERVIITIFDNDIYSKRLLLELKISKMIYKSIYNNNPQNKENVLNELISIIQGKQLPLNDYIIHKFHKYMNISFFF